MRAWIFVLAVLATIIPIVQVASTDKRINLDPGELELFEKTLFAQLGMEKRTRIVDRSNIVIPNELQDIYNKMMHSQEYSDSISLPLPGANTKSANTIRSFAHEGKYLYIV